MMLAFSVCPVPYSIPFAHRFCSGAIFSFCGLRESFLQLFTHLGLLSRVPLSISQSLKIDDFGLSSHQMRSKISLMPLLLACFEA